MPLEFNIKEQTVTFTGLEGHIYAWRNKMLLSHLHSIRWIFIHEMYHFWVAFFLMNVNYWDLKWYITLRGDKYQTDYKGHVDICITNEELYMNKPRWHDFYYGLCSYLVSAAPMYMYYVMVSFTMLIAMTPAAFIVPILILFTWSSTAQQMSFRDKRTYLHGKKLFIKSLKKKNYAKQARVGLG